MAALIRMNHDAHLYILILSAVASPMDKCLSSRVATMKMTNMTISKSYGRMPVNSYFGAAATLLAAVIALTGAYVGVSLRRQLRSRVSERRLAAYAALWQLTEKAAPSRQRALSEAERRQLFKELTSWYYRDGSGMCLTSGCRNVFLEAKANLIKESNELHPVLHKYVFQEEGQEERRRSDLTISQLSLLRTRMRADLDIFGRWYQKEGLSEEARNFLKDCGEDPSKYPWRLPARRRRVMIRLG
jgi:hypothetical protein